MLLSILLILPTSYRNNKIYIIENGLRFFFFFLFTLLAWTGLKGRLSTILCKAIYEV